MPEIVEPLLVENPNRYVIYPIQHDDIWAEFKKQEASFWTAEEIDLNQDLNDWKKLNDNERYFIKHVLAFFAASDGIVNENLCYNFATEVQYPEARAAYTFQAAMETIHSETYSLLIDTYVDEENEKLKLLRAIDNFEIPLTSIFRSFKPESIGCGNAKGVKNHSQEKCKASRIHFDNIPKQKYKLKVGQ